MSVQIAKNFTDAISALIQKEVEATLLRLRGKIFQALDADEEQVEIDVTKFAQNTVKKIIESEDYTTIIEKTVSAKAEKAEKANKEKKEKKDPDAPKGAKNSYIFFCNEVRSDVKEENPEMKATEITKKMGEMWKELSDKKKVKYQKMADKDKTRYAEEMSSYEPKEGFKNPKEKSKKAKKAESTVPKRGRSAYIFFCVEKREEVKKKNPKISNTEILSEMGKMWKSLSEKKKKPYVEMAEADKKRYEEEMKHYVPSEEEKATKESKVKGKKGGKVVKSSNRTLSAYLLFCKDNRGQVKDENPSSKMTEITTILGKMWKELSDKKKKPYVEQAEKLKDAKAAEKAEEKEVEKDDDVEEEEVEKDDDVEEVEVDEDKENDSDDEDKENDSDDESLFSDDEEEENEEFSSSSKAYAKVSAKPAKPTKK